MQHGDDENWLCRTGPVLTIYLATAPTRDEVLAAWRVYRDICPKEHLRLVRSTADVLFFELHDPYDERALDRHLVEQDLRRDRGVWVWDGGKASCWSFLIQGAVLPGYQDVASFCQVMFPDDTPPDVIHTTALRLADAIPFLSGQAGIGCLFAASLKESAFDQIYAWTRRYLGLEVEDLNATLPVVLDAVKGANWLTLIGRTLWEELIARSGKTPSFEPPVSIEEARFGHVIRAGERPVLADRNRQVFPAAYAAVERALEPIKLTDHPEFAGRFAEEEATMPWLRRLLEPDNW